MNPYLNSTNPLIICFSSPSIFIDAERERFSANNLQRTKIIFRRREWSQVECNDWGC